ncbi:GNAT family N-acetyltransferase [Leifsonia shinshuensis]|uniref:GNAT family N-acetyltransferase n=1 Tax=Leifsonia shinshuensis TaxID=150026 RepID=A0A7G6YDD8_9MICO|nr:GNAT family N-acetyltransferase [Leifsonia shinshuensis]QNE36503.1 GNAT family N-acetyltransferase [Leifsonia shinshuensis]
MRPPEPAVLDRLADRGWPALERDELGGWTLRATGGVTNRANSVLTAGVVPDVEAAIERAERWYRERGLPAAFQVSPASPPALGEALARRGYREHSRTDILVADRAEVASAASVADIAVSDTPQPGWLATWWAVDGRGGDAERAIVARILEAGPALYAAADGDDGAPPAVARLALAGDWAGLYAVATLPAARRRGLARALAVALAEAAGGRGVRHLWLQVLADNAAAHALYSGLGFRPASHYAYWTAPAG